MKVHNAQTNGAAPGLPIAIVLAASVLCSFGQTPAFPGAIGFGANATGGRYGTVYRVTTLADSGPGSFRDAVSQPNRIIIFDVGGYITLQSEVALSRNLTIAGQTAPGGGIGIIGAEVTTGSSTNIIIRHVRFRPGSGADSGAHCVNLRGTNMILDHVSLEYGKWNNVGGVNANQLTIMRSFIADPIGQQFGAHMERLGGSVTWYLNVFANAHGRQPLSKINTIYINNIVYNYQAAYDCGDTSGYFYHDVVNNYFITGPATTSPDNDFYQMNSRQSMYVTGNLRDANRNGVLDGTITVPESVVLLDLPWSSVTTNIPTYTTLNAFRVAVSVAGAFPRDAMDQFIMNEVRTAGVSGPYPLPTSQTRTGLPNNGFGYLASGTPPLDTDQDGMPDYWELATGSNPNVNDAMTIGPDGYARIEHYLNWLAEPHALTLTNTPVDIELWLYTSGFTNANPVYVVDNATNGIVSLLPNGHVARFTPATNFIGLAGFTFAVVASDGTAYTNNVGIVVSMYQEPRDLVWVGDGIANVWDVGNATNWSHAGVPTVFASGDNATFDDSGSSSPAINLVGSISAGTVVVSAAKNYTFSGSGGLVGPTRLIKEGSGMLIINTSNTLGGGALLNDGVVQLGDGISANGSLNGNITNNTTLIFANPGAVAATANISGSGAIIKRGTGTFTLSGTQTYTNLTTIEVGTLEFAGVPPTGDITNNSVLVFRPTSATTYSGRISGPGYVTVAASGGTLTLSSANTFSGGINLTAGSLVLANNRAAGTGNVTNSGSGSVYVADGVVITNGFALPSSTTDLNMRCDSGTGVWAGDVVYLGSGASWRPGSDGGTLIFTGRAIQGARNFIVPRGTVHFASNAYVSATGPATALGRDGTDGNRSARITLRDNAVMELGACSMGGGKQGGYITLTIQDNAVLSTGTNNFDLHNVNRATATNTIRLNGGTFIVGGFVKTRSSYTNTVVFNGGTLCAGTNNSAFLPAFANQTAIVQAGGVRIDDAGFAITIAQPLNHDTALGATLDGGLTKLGGGTVTLTGANTYNGPTMIYAGALALAGSGTIQNSTNIHVAAGATFDLTGIAGGTFTIGQGRMLWGNGTCIGNFTAAPGAIINPGSNGIGRLVVNGNLTLLAGCTNLFELSKSAATNDTVQVTGTCILGGTLIVTNIGGATLSAGDTFTLLDAGTLTGTFGTVQLPDLGAGLAWDISQLTSAGTIRVVLKAPPVIERFWLEGTKLIFNGRGGTPGAQYRVLTSTNIALPATSWVRLCTNQFLPDGSFAVTNSVAPELPQQFYMLELLWP